MILEQLIVILKILILGIFIAIMFDNISRYCNYFISILIWIPITYVICRVLLNITIYFEMTYIFYYLILFGLAYYLYYKYFKKRINLILDRIIIFVKNNKKIKKITKFIFLVEEVKYIIEKIKSLIKKIKIKKIKKDSKTFDFIK